jgi:hypothetical protein
MSYRETHKEHLKTRAKIRYEVRKANGDKPAYDKSYYEANKKERLAKRNMYDKARAATDPLYRVKRSLRRRTSMAFKEKTWSDHNTFSVVIGCTQQELKTYIEKQFTSGMTWDNFGEWQVDHIIPVSIATTIEELNTLCHYTNLQPLWAKDNRNKGASLPVALNPNWK